MKPCSKNRKLLALLALGNLDAEEATALRDHVATCQGCRCFLNELAKVTASISAAEMNTDIVTTATFHRRVVAAVKAEEARTVWPNVGGFFRGTLLKWRVVFPTLGGIGIVFVVGLLLNSQPKSGAALPGSSKSQSDSAHSRVADFRPTIANYQMVANQSLEKLDQLLSEQGSRRLPPAPVYKASALIAADVSD
jgi:hypothetical protein